MRKEIIKPGIIRSIIQKVENGSHEKVSEELVDRILDALFDTIVEALENGNQITLKGYMTIYPQLYRSMKVRNVADNEEIEIPERYKPKIKAGVKLRNACKKLI